MNARKILSNIKISNLNTERLKELRDEYYKISIATIDVKESMAYSDAGYFLSEEIERREPHRPYSFD